MNKPNNIEIQNHRAKGGEKGGNHKSRKPCKPHCCDFIQYHDFLLVVRKVWYLHPYDWSCDGCLLYHDRSGFACQYLRGKTIRKIRHPYAVDWERLYISAAKPSMI